MKYAVSRSSNEPLKWDICQTYNGPTGRFPQGVWFPVCVPIFSKFLISSYCHHRFPFPIRSQPFIPVWNPCMLCWIYPAWSSTFLAQRRSLFWPEDRDSWRCGAAAGVAEGCGAPRKKFLVYSWRGNDSSNELWITHVGIHARRSLFNVSLLQHVSYTSVFTF